MKKTVRLLAMAVIAALAVSAAAAEEEPVRVYQPAASAYSFEIPESLMEEELPEGAAESGMATYLADPGTGLCIEIYRLDREGKTLEAFVEEDAAKYGGTDVVPVGEFRGLTAGWYDIADPDGQYRIQYLFLEDGDSWLVIGYTLNSDEAADEIFAVLNTLKRIDP